MSRPLPIAAAPIAGHAIRASYLAAFPRWSQPFWTWFTGKPLPGESPWMRRRPSTLAIITAAWVVLLVALQLMLLKGGVAARVLGWLAAPAFLVCATGAFRKCQVVYLHHSAHQTFVPRHRRANALAGNLVTTFALIQNPAEYKDDHFDHHHRQVFTTLADADAAFLFRFGLRPGRTVGALRRALLIALFSPAYHAAFLVSRLRSNLVTRPWPWRLASAAWLAVVAVGLPSAFGLGPVALAVWLPLVVGYQMSALLQFLTEHLWLITPNAPADPAGYAARCHGRFCGEQVPPPRSAGGRAGEWAGWWARTVLLHAPMRLGVLVGDLPAHDWHHLCGFIHQSPSQWPEALYARQRAIDTGLSMGMEDRELWGLPRMLDVVLGALSEAPPMAMRLAPPQGACGSAAGAEGGRGGEPAAFDGMARPVDVAA